MKRLPSIAVNLALLWTLSVGAWAGPRVAIVTPLAGDVRLDGVPLKAPRIAEEGQQLTVAAGGEARLQLLGSSKEKRLQGRADYTVSKAKLQSDGKPLSRGSVSVTSEIGNLSRAAAAGSRVGRVYLYSPVGLALVLPPTPIEGGWETRSFTPLEQIKASPDSAIVLKLRDLSHPDPDSTEIKLVMDTPTDLLTFEKSVLMPGNRYELQISRPSESGYVRYFQILTPEEHAALVATEQAMRAEAAEHGEFATLLRLGAMYQDFDQTPRVAEMLMEAVTHPDFRTLGKDEREDLVSELNRARRSLDMSFYDTETR